MVGCWWDACRVELEMSITILQERVESVRRVGPFPRTLGQCMSKALASDDLKVSNRTVSELCRGRPRQRQA